MKLKDIKTIAVIGGGTMGSQIAELLSKVGGYQVMLWSRRDETVKRGLDSISDRLQKFFVDKGKMTADEKDAIMGRITGTTDMAAAWLIIQEAGAKITTPEGEPLRTKLHPQQKVEFIAAANQSIHKAILDTLKQRKERT